MLAQFWAGAYLTLGLLWACTGILETLWGGQNPVILSHTRPSDRPPWVRTPPTKAREGRIDLSGEVSGVGPDTFDGGGLDHAVAY